MTVEDVSGFPCVCGCENFQRVIVERVLSKPVITDLLACVECRCVYYSPLPRAGPVVHDGPAMGSGVVTNSPDLLKHYGASPDYPRVDLSPDEHRALLERAQRANKSKKRR